MTNTYDLTGFLPTVLIVTSLHRQRCGVETKPALKNVTSSLTARYSAFRRKNPYSSKPPLRHSRFTDPTNNGFFTKTSSGSALQYTGSASRFFGESVAGDDESNFTVGKGNHIVSASASFAGYSPSEENIPSNTDGFKLQTQQPQSRSPDRDSREEISNLEAFLNLGSETDLFETDDDGDLTDFVSEDDGFGTPLAPSSDDNIGYQPQPQLSSEVEGNREFGPGILTNSDEEENPGDADDTDDEVISNLANRGSFEDDDDNDFTNISNEDQFADELPLTTSSYNAPRQGMMDDLDENDDMPDDDENQYFGTLESNLTYDDNDNLQIADDDDDGDDDDNEDDEDDDADEDEDDEDDDDVSDDDDDDDIQSAADILSNRGLLGLGAKKGWRGNAPPVRSFDLDDDNSGVDNDDAGGDFDDDAVDKDSLDIGEEDIDDDDEEDVDDADDDVDLLTKESNVNDIDDYQDMDEVDDDIGLTSPGSVGRVWELCEDTYITITDPGESYGYELDEDDQEDQDMSSIRRGKEGGWSGGLASYPSSALQEGSKEWVARRTYELMMKASSVDLYRWAKKHSEPPPEIAALYPEGNLDPLPIGKGTMNTSELPSYTETVLESDELEDKDIEEEDFSKDMEALKRSIKFPCSYKFKLEGDPNDDRLIPALRETTEGILNRKVPDTAFKIEEADSRFNHRVIIVVEVKNARQVTELYDALRTTPGVKYSYG